MKSTATVWLAAFTLLLGIGSDRAVADTSVRPNILWITLEDVSQDVGGYGAGYAQTP